MCHKYPKMARITEDGARRSYYVIPEVFGNTVHRNVECGDCHDYIQQLPHREVSTGVTCDSECHSVDNPATGKPFSHKPIVELYKKSVHSRSKITTGNDQDKPYCITCHTNPIYNPKEVDVPQDVVTRCVICHEDPRFVESWYKHTGRRINEVRRSSNEVIALCSNCHGDKQQVTKHMQAAKEENRELGEKYPIAVESYNKSFHGKVTRYGHEEAANCLDCHADNKSYYLNAHNILPSRDPKASTSSENRLETCKRCHKFADQNYALIDPHPLHSEEHNPVMYWIEHIYSWVGNLILVGLCSLALFETIGRRRDGVGWQVRDGSSWRRKSRRGRDRTYKSRHSKGE